MLHLDDLDDRDSDDSSGVSSSELDEGQGHREDGTVATGGGKKKTRQYRRAGKLLNKISTELQQILTLIGQGSSYQQPPPPLQPAFGQL
jgi:hypothetical protein